MANWFTEGMLNHHKSPAAPSTICGRRRSGMRPMPTTAPTANNAVRNRCDRLRGSRESRRSSFAATAPIRERGRNRATDGNRDGPRRRSSRRPRRTAEGAAVVRRRSRFTDHKTRSAKAKAAAPASSSTAATERPAFASTTTRPAMPGAIVAPALRSLSAIFSSITASPCPSMASPYVCGRNEA